MSPFQRRGSEEFHSRFCHQINMIISSTSDFSNFSRDKSKFYIFEDQTNGENVKMIQIINQMFVNSDTLLKNGFPMNHFTRIGETQEIYYFKKKKKHAEDWRAGSVIHSEYLQRTQTGFPHTQWIDCHHLELAVQ